MGGTYHFVTLIRKLLLHSHLAKCLIIKSGKVIRGTNLNRRIPSEHGRHPRPRTPRHFVTGATYHVYCRVARGEFVFDDPNEVAEAWMDATH